MKLWDTVDYVSSLIIMYHNNKRGNKDETLINLTDYFNGFDAWLIKCPDQRAGRKFFRIAGSSAPCPGRDFGGQIGSAPLAGRIGKRD
jgi:hypothetical protein